MTDRKPTLDEAIATEFFGWRWVARIGIPVRDAPGYPEKCRVRLFLPAKHVEDLEDADGTEPLDYCYCSSSGCPTPPRCSSDFEAIQELEKQIRKRRLWNEYAGRVLHEMGTHDVYKLLSASCEVRCKAALAVVAARKGGYS